MANKKMMMFSCVQSR